MKKQPLNIPQPTLLDAVPLTAAELNNLTYVNRHTLLTPELMAKMASDGS